MKCFSKKLLSLLLALIMAMGLTHTSGALETAQIPDNAPRLSDSDLDARIADIDLNAALAISSNSSPIAPMNQVWEQTWEFFIATSGGDAATGNIMVYPGEVIHFQMTQPNDSAIDYDLYLAETNSAGSVIAWVDASEYATRIRTGYGTMPESVGAYNGSSQTKYYRALIVSWVGANPSIPAILRARIATTTDPNEAKQNLGNNLANIQQRIQLNTQSATSATVGKMITTADNDWFVAQIPASASYTQVNVTLDAASTAAGYRVQVVTTPAQPNIQTLPFSTTRGVDFYVRVYSESASYLTGAAYTLTFTPVTTTSNPQPGSATSSFSRSSGTMNAIWGGYSAQWPASSGTIPSQNAQVTSVTVRLVVSAGSSPVNFYVESPANSGNNNKSIISYMGTYPVGTHTLTFNSFNGVNPSGTWYMWMETMGVLSSATATITVNYRY